MFNAFNAQHPYGEGNYHAWQQTGYGDLQGNSSATAGVNSYLAVGNMFQGHPGAPQGPYTAYGMYPQQADWHQTYQQHQAYQQPTYPYSQNPASEQPPPLPEGAPPPLPPPPAEEPPPLPPDGPGGPLAPPLPSIPDSQPRQAPEHPSQPQAPTAHAGDYPQGLASAQSWPPQYTQHMAMAGPRPAAAAAGWYPHPHQQLQYQSTTHPAPALGPSHYGSYQHPQAPAVAPHGFAGPHQPPIAVNAAHVLPSATPYPHHHVPAVQPGAGSSRGGAVIAASSGPVAGPGGPTAVPAAVLPPEPVVVDITRLLRQPHRASRPRKLLLVLRGLPGSGKTTLARKIREAELEAGADPPRLHSIDDYYMQETEVEIVEEEGGRKKRRKVTELQYVYEPEMEGTYFRDLVRAVGRSCEDRRHSFVVVDAPVLRSEQLRELMAVGQRANFECYVLRPLEPDPVVCAAPGRNVHGHRLERLRELAASWEDAPPLYAQVSAVSLFGGPVVGEESGNGRPGSKMGPAGGDDEIQEVEMDAEDDDSDEDGNRGPIGVDGDGDADEATTRRRPTSRWHNDDGDQGEYGSGSGGGDYSGRWRQQRRKKKRDKASRLRAVSDIDDRGILSGLNDALGAAEGAAVAGSKDGGKGGSAAAAEAAGSGTRRGGSGPLRSALRSMGPLVEAVAAAAKRRVWWPDLGLGRERQGEGQRDAMSERATPQPLTPQQSEEHQDGGPKLVTVVYLEGLGPPQELEDLPYGYQRKAPAGRGAGAGPGAATYTGAAGPLQQQGAFAADESHHHNNFRDQAKAEHESEHDLFRRLLLGKQGGGGGRRDPGGGGTSLGLFEVGDDDEEEDN